MALTILLLLLFTVILLLYGWRNRYLVFFAVLVLASALSMFTLTVEVAKVSNYLVPANYLKDDVKMRQALDTLKKGFEKKEEAAE